MKVSVADRSTGESIDADVEVEHLPENYDGCVAVLLALDGSGFFEPGTVSMAFEPSEGNVLWCGTPRSPIRAVKIEGSVFV